MTDAEIGKQFVLAGKYRPTKMREAMCIIAYFNEQRKLVAETGSCAAKCQCEQVEHANGYMVCPHTWEPCKAKRIPQIVALFSRIFANEHSA